MGKRIDFGSLRRLKPVSQHWGFDRGTPIDRYYIEAFLARHAALVRGTVLEVKGREYLDRYGGDRVERAEVLDVDPGNAAATLVADLHEKEAFPSAEFDCILVTQTLQFVREPARAIETLHHALKAGGTLLLTCPGITRIASKGPSADWYWSFTQRSLEMLLEPVFGAGGFECASNGNVFAASCFLWGVAAEELEAAELDHFDPRYPVILTVRAVKR